MTEMDALRRMLETLRQIKVKPEMSESERKAKVCAVVGLLKVAGNEPPRRFQ